MECLQDSSKDNWSTNRLARLCKGIYRQRWWVNDTSLLKRTLLQLLNSLSSCLIPPGRKNPIRFRSAWNVKRKYHPSFVVRTSLSSLAARVSMNRWYHLLQPQIAVRHNANNMQIASSSFRSLTPSSPYLWTVAFICRIKARQFAN
jgi:hypothetical protein